MAVAWKETTLSGRTFTQCRIYGEPADLPDGPYTLEIAGHQIITRKWQGDWLLNFLPPDIDIKRAA